MQSWQQVYGYDRYGNRRFAVGTSIPAALNSQTNPTINPLTNRFTAGQGYAYDNGASNSAGNLTAAPGYTYSYDAENRLVSSNYSPTPQVNPNTYACDGLNRVITRNYSDAMLAVSYSYDTPGIAHSMGRLTKVSSSVSTTSYAAFGALGRGTQSSQVTAEPLHVQSYILSYEYDLVGTHTREVYPSGRIITHSYDGAGRINSVTEHKENIYWQIRNGTK